jgi:membrane protease YdiL (CAAX protease family)
MVAYPLVSVLPQELVYRVFFFERYRPLFGDGIAMVLASAVTFGCAHLVFRSGLAVILTMIGGILFGVTYKRSGSWLLAGVEHAMYGCALFTIGYGQYFLDGTLRLFRS